jgi:CrcB protein
MNAVLVVALGGALGSVARYFVTLAARMLWPGFPWGTLVVNVVGGFAMGLLIAYASGRPGFSETLRIGLGVGILGGFTTFSAFSIDTVLLLREGSMLLMAANIAGNLLLSLGACMLGHWLGRGLP